MNPRRDWFAGLVLGAWAGFALVYFAIVGAVLILFMAFRPQGLFGKREEMVLGD